MPADWMSLWLQDPRPRTPESSRCSFLNQSLPSYARIHICTNLRARAYATISLFPPLDTLLLDFALNGALVDFV